MDNTEIIHFEKSTLLNCIKEIETTDNLLSEYKGGFCFIATFHSNTRGLVGGIAINTFCWMLAPNRAHRIEQAERKLKQLTDLGFMYSFEDKRFPTGCFYTVQKNKAKRTFSDFIYPVMPTEINSKFAQKLPSFVVDFLNQMADKNAEFMQIEKFSHRTREGKLYQPFGSLCYWTH